MQTFNQWQHGFLQQAGAYEIFNGLDLSLLDQKHWPNLSTLNIIAKNNHFFHFELVPTQEKASILNYEQHILETNTIPTRQKNWHDFFNFLIWLSFPEMKKHLNRWHCQEMKQRKDNQRTQLENAMTLFDENGIILASSDPTLLSLVKEHRWHELFWERREELETTFDCVVFGHSLHEKLLSPYIGMTGHGVLLDVSQEYFQLSRAEQLIYLDQLLSEHPHYHSPKDLQPFPLLGMPGWHKNNDQKVFYTNQTYFRPKPSKTLVSY